MWTHYKILASHGNIDWNTLGNIISADILGEVRLSADTVL